MIAEAENGQRALDLAQIERPNLITMDLRMPDMDGKTAIALLLKRIRTLQQIPIIVVSVLPEEGPCGGDAFHLQAGRRGGTAAGQRPAACWSVARRWPPAFGTNGESSIQAIWSSNLPDQETSLPNSAAAKETGIDPTAPWKMQAHLGGRFLPACWWSPPSHSRNWTCNRYFESRRYPA